MNGSALSFIRPAWLLALLPLGLLLWQLWRAPEPGASVWRRLVDAHLLAHLLVMPHQRTRRIGLTLLAGGLLAAVLALAGPTLKQSSQAVSRPDVLRLLVLDLSPDMTVPLAQVKLKLLALLKAWPEGRTALLVYGGEPYLVVPPTTDVETIALFVPDLAVEALPVPGHHPELAWRMAREIFARNPAQQRELVWITAGGAGTVMSQAELAGVRLSILQASGEPDPFLVAAASRSGGVQLPMRADDGDIRQLLGALATHARLTAVVDTVPGERVDLGYWLLLPLLPLAALAFRRGLLVCLLAVLLAGLLTPPPALAQGFSLTAMVADEQAWCLLQAGQPQAAAARFADPRWRAVAQYRAGQFEQAARGLASGRDADAHYNRGNALAQQGQLAEALAAYEQALVLRADDADTLHNRDLVQRLLKPPPPEPPQGSGRRAPQPPGRGASSAGPPPVPRAAELQGPGNAAELEAERVAEQWLRRIPDQPGSLLRRKLLAEQQLRQRGAATRSW